MPLAGESEKATGVRDGLDLEYEQLLVARARHDPDDFRELYREYFPRVYAYVAYRVGTVQDTKDLVSDTFLKAVENVSRFDYRGMGSFAAWLFRIAHNVVSDFCCQRGRRQEPLSLETVRAHVKTCGNSPPAVHAIRWRSAVGEHCR